MTESLSAKYIQENVSAVGGDTDVYSINVNEQDGLRRVHGSGQTREWEQEIDTMNHWTDVLFSYLSNKNSDVSLDLFVERVRAFRERVGGKPLKLSAD